MIDLLDFKEKIAAKLTAESCTAAVLFGRSHLDRNDNQGSGTANRVVVAPGGDPDADDWGTISAGSKAHVRTYPGEGTHSERLVIDVWAYDGTAAADEGAQYRALRELWNRVFRAIGNCLREGRHTNTWWGSNPRILSNPTDRRHGARMRVTFTVDFDIRTIAPTVDITDAEAVITAETEA